MSSRYIKTKDKSTSYTSVPQAAPMHNIATRDQTASSTRSVAVNPTIARYMANLRDSGLADLHPTPINIGHEDIGHEETVPPTPENLPVVLTGALAAGMQPKWHMVHNLPGYMSSAIRAMGRQVFAPFTTTPIERIQVISSMTNPEGELRGFGGWLKKHGRRNDKLAMKFADIFPGYQADIHVWHALGYTFIVVVDQFGKYVYSWPDDSNRTH